LTAYGLGFGGLWRTNRQWSLSGLISKTTPVDSGGRVTNGMAFRRVDLAVSNYDRLVVVGAHGTGLLVAVEGIGGSGKSTLARRLVDWLQGLDPLWRRVTLSSRTVAHPLGRGNLSAVSKGKAPQLSPEEEEAICTRSWPVL
jgi:hypothetical protein